MSPPVTHHVDSFANFLEVDYEHQTFLEASCHLLIQPNHRNSLGGIHGAVIFSLADITFAAACNASDGRYIGTQAEIRYMRGTDDQDLRATARLVGQSNRFAHYSVLVNDGKGREVALFTASAYKLGN